MLSLLYTLVKLAKSHYLLLSFVCILYIVFACLFKLFVCIFNFSLPLVVNKDVQKYCVMFKSLPVVQQCHRQTTDVRLSSVCDIVAPQAETDGRFMP